MKLYNTLSRHIEEFKPLSNNRINFFACGPTVYDYSHLGHAMSYIIFDVVRRYLEFRGYRVRHVQNYTDIDDKLIARSNSSGVPVEELATRYIETYEEEMRDPEIRALITSGAPLAEIELVEPSALGAEFVRWEVATAVAGALLRINPFDEPNVQQAKDATQALLGQFKSAGKLPIPPPDRTLHNGIALTLDLPATLADDFAALDQNA